MKGKYKWIVRILWAIGLGFPFCAQSMTIEELRQIVQDTGSPPSHGRFTYVEVEHNYGPISDKAYDPTRPGAKSSAEINQHTHTRISIVFHDQTNRLATAKEDLRNIDLLVRGKPDSEAILKGNVSQTETVVTEGKYVLAYSQPSNLASAFSQPGTVRNPMHSNERFGYVPLNWLTSTDSIPTRFEVWEDEIGDRPVVKVEAYRTMQGLPWKCTMLLDPALGFRYREVFIVYGGKKITTITADGYRDVDGIVMPTIYEKIRQTLDGERLHKTVRVTYEKMDFHTPVNDADFEILLPQGTRIENMLTDIGDFAGYRTRQEEYFSIAKVVGYQANRLAESQIAAMMESAHNVPALGLVKQDPITLTQIVPDENDLPKTDSLPTNATPAITSIVLYGAVFIALLGAVVFFCRRKLFFKG